MKEKIVSMFYNVGDILQKITPEAFVNSSASVLMYHRILPKKQLINNYSGIIVSVENFEKQIVWLKKYKTIISLDELLNIKSVEELKNKVILTFDDGYLDNLTYALPILEKYSAPATVYITNRFLHGDATMWWEELNYILQNRKNLEFNFQGVDYCFKADSPKSIDSTYKKLRALFVSLDYKDQNILLSTLRGNNPIMNFKSEVLDIQNLKKLASSSLITIGSHTVNHLVLKQQNADMSFSEIAHSVSDLESILNKKIEHFAYPFGSPNEVSPREVEFCKKIGLKTATTTSYGFYDLNSNLLMLPRIAIKDRTTEKHLRVKLSGFNGLFNGVQI